MTKRSKFWTVVFSFLPGAGHMFMGFMKQGTSLMLAFFGLFAISLWLNIGEVMVVMPVLWFYSFFDCVNKRFSTDERFMRFEDKYLFQDWFQSNTNINFGKFRIAVSILLIVVGAYSVFSNAMEMIDFGNFLSNWELDMLRTVLHQLPRIAVGILIIVFGVKLICGKKKEISSDEQN